MKIAYLAHWRDVTNENGVLKKIATQVRAWRSLGEDAHLFLLAHTTEPWVGMRDLPVEMLQHGHVLRRAARMKTLVQRILAWHPDVVYLRFGTWYPALDLLTETIPTVLEVNGHDVIQTRMNLPWYRQFYHGITRKRTLRRAAGMVSVAYQLAVLGEPFQLPTTVIGNSIDLSDYPPLPAPANPHPRLILIGDAGKPGTNKNGWEKIIWLAQHRPQWHIDLVGIAPEEMNTALPANLTAHGFLPRDRYEPLLAAADAALGPLALHRASIAETSAIKVPEYLAFGLPVILGYTETNFPKPVPYILQLPNTEDNVATHVHEIEQFLSQWRGRRVPRADIQHVDVRVKEQERLAFLRKITGNVS